LRSAAARSSAAFRSAADTSNCVESIRFAVFFYFSGTTSDTCALPFSSTQR
jgi:hypothetical protein